MVRAPILLVTDTAQPTQSQPFPTDTTTTVVNSAIDGVFGVAVKAVQSGLIALDPPVFGNPVLETIDDEVIQLVANEIYKQFALWVDFDIIDFKVGGEVTDEKKALIALKAAQKAGDKNAEAQALSDFQKSVVGVTHIDGSANP